MLQQIIDQILKDVENFKAENKEQVEEFRLKFLSKKGELSKVFDEFRNVPNEQKKELGQKINFLKQTAQAKFEALQRNSESSEDEFESLFRTFLLQNIIMFVSSRRKKHLCQRTNLQLGGKCSEHVPKLLRYGKHVLEKSNELAALCVPSHEIEPMTCVCEVKYQDSSR